MEEKNRIERAEWTIPQSTHSARIDTTRRCSSSQTMMRRAQGEGRSSVLVARRCCHLEAMGWRIQRDCKARPQRTRHEQTTHFPRPNRFRKWHPRPVQVENTGRSHSFCDDTQLISPRKCQGLFRLPSPHLIREIERNKCEQRNGKSGVRRQVGVFLAQRRIEINHTAVFENKSLLRSQTDWTKLHGEHEICLKHFQLSDTRDFASNWTLFTTNWTLC